MGIKNIDEVVKDLNQVVIAKRGLPVENTEHSEV
jgi:hypothetical protein